MEERIKILERKNYHYGGSFSEIIELQDLKSARTGQRRPGDIREVQEISQSLSPKGQATGEERPKGSENHDGEIAIKQ